MKITKADLISLITEILEEEEDNYSKALKTLRDKQKALRVRLAQVDVEIAKELNNQAMDKEKTASDLLDAAEKRGEDTAKEKDALNSAKKNTQKTRDGITAAENALKTAQKGG